MKSIPPIEYIWEGDRLVRYDEWRKRHPLTPTEIAQNARDLLLLVRR